MLSFITTSAGRLQLHWCGALVSPARVALCISGTVRRALSCAVEGTCLPHYFYSRAAWRLAISNNTKPNNKNTPMLQFLFLLHFHHIHRSPIPTESIRSHILYGNGRPWLKIRSSAGGRNCLPTSFVVNCPNPSTRPLSKATLLLQQWDKLHRIQTSNGKIPKCRFIPDSVFTFKTARSLLENSYDNIILTFPICC